MEVNTLTLNKNIRLYSKTTMQRVQREKERERERE